MQDDPLHARLLLYIDRLYANWSRRPDAYSPSPQSMESTFVTLERLREFMLSDGGAEPPVPDCGYARFLHHEYPALGVRSFTWREPSGCDSGEEAQATLFAEFVECWGRFLASAYRKQRESDKRCQEPLNERKYM
jgi:hypothetical protein